MCHDIQVSANMMASQLNRIKYRLLAKLWITKVQAYPSSSTRLLVLIGSVTWDCPWPEHISLTLFGWCKRRHAVLTPERQILRDNALLVVVDTGHATAKQAETNSLPRLTLREAT